MTGLDILWIAIAFAIILLAAFWCAVLWRVARLLWDIHGLVDEGKEAIHDVRRSLIGLTSRLEGHVQAVTLLGDRLVRLVKDGWQHHQEKKQTARKNTTTRGDDGQG